MDLKVSKGCVVELAYKLKNEKGELLEERDSANPLLYLHGSNQLLTILEKSLEGQIQGFQTTLTVPPKQGYGDFDKTLITEVPLSVFPKELTLQPGMRFDTHGPKGEYIVVEVKEIKGDKVKIDGNHPLAGKTLVFDLKVMSVREATAEELEHGHAHGPHGHHH